MFALFRRRLPGPPHVESPSQMFLAAGKELVVALDGSLSPYIEELVTGRLCAQREMTAAERDLIKMRSQQVTTDILKELWVFVGRDVDEQRSTPLEIVRGFVRPMTEVCRRLGMQPVRRDRFLVERFNEDDYDLTPANLAVINNEVADAALVWGAAKAFEHKVRHKTH